MAGELQGKVREKLKVVREAYRGFRRGLDGRQERLFRIFSFLMKFLLLAAPFYLVLGSGWEAEGLRGFIAGISASILQLLGIKATSSGTFVEVGNLLLDVTRDSTGWKSVAVLAALVFASPLEVGEKLKGVLVGVPLILAVNVLRIVSMVYAVTVWGVEYEFLHLFLWRWGLTGAVILLWASWIHFSGSGFRVSLPER
ncbi:MAG: archaeosortase/exosortase family protein [Candidatus Nanohaloarchaea archaeon]|nr:archaeosortase/exosortase family protein [Candidatus Nanohaloarchaea archaeon]